ncbi:hypothetical protein FHG87_020296, partial [Trinorchestia longiramus]
PHSPPTGIDFAKKDLITGQKIRSKRAAGLVLLRLQAAMQQVSITLSKGDLHLAYAHVTGLTVGVVQDSAKITIRSSLRDVGVSDPNPHAPHQQMVRVEDRSAWDCTVELYSSPDPHQRLVCVDDVDVSVSLTMGKTRLVFINAFIADILAWVNTVQGKMASPLVGAGEVAAEAAKANLAEMYQQQLRVKLDCTIKAPLVVVPECSSGLKGLLVNLGELRVLNKLEVSGQRNQLGQPAIFDCIDMTLTDVTIAATDDVSRPPSQATQEACPPLLSPITFSVAVRRNLASAWLLKEALVAVTATLHPIQMRVREEDVRLVMRLLKYNLGQGASEGPAAPDAAAA